MILISIIIALIIERLGARAQHWQADFYLQNYHSKTKSWTRSGGILGTHLGIMIWLVLPALAVALIYNFSDFAVWQFAVNICILLICFGCAKYRKLYKGYLNALTRGDNEAASLYAWQMGQDKLEDEPGGETFGQTLSWINFQHYCGVIFWFVALGAPGAVLYAAVRQVVHWQHEQEAPPMQHVSEQLCRLFYWLNWIPARIASFGFLIIGNFTKGTSTWLKHVLDFKTTNRKIVTTTALAAEQIEQQFLGCTFEASCMMRLVKRNILFYLVIIAILTLFGWIE